MPNLVRLSDLKVGMIGIIRDFDKKPENAPTVMRLIEYGFVPNESVSIEQPFQFTTGALTASIHQSAIGLGIQEASLIWVEIP
jgi:Fe2+ transport system protein FeoA